MPNAYLEGLETAGNPYSSSKGPYDQQTQESTQDEVNRLISQANVELDGYGIGTGGKAEQLTDVAAEKRARLRKDTADYGTDSTLVRVAKEAWNTLAPHSAQLGVNVDGKQYNTQNKVFNDDDMTNVWDEIDTDPNGDSVMYYMRKNDGLDEQGNIRWLYKPGIAAVGASDRYIGQLKDDQWELLGEKRFNGAELTENKIHGNKNFLQYRAFDKGRSSEDKDYAESNGLAWNDFGAGKSELYTQDILGLDRGTAEDYAANKAISDANMQANWAEPYMRNDTIESLDALGAAVQTLAGKGIKGVGSLYSAIVDGDEVTGDGALEKYGKEVMENAGKNWGYNDKSLKEGSKSMRRGWADLSEGRPGGLFKILGGLIQAGPQVVAGSAPEMAAYVGGGTALIAAKVGLLTLANTNDALDIREKANDGRKATHGEAAQVFAGQTFASMLDMGSFRLVSKLGKPFMVSKKGKDIGSFAEAIKDIPDATKFEMAKALGGSVKRGTIAGATEATQEVSTEAVRMLTETLDTDKYGDDAFEIIMSGEGTGRLTNAAALGSAGGVMFNAPSNAIETSIAANNVRNRMATAKASKEAADNVRDVETAEESIASSEVDNANLAGTYEQLRTERAELDNITDIDKMQTAIDDSTMPPAVKEQIYKAFKKNPKMDVDSLREMAQNVMEKTLKGYAEGGKKEQMIQRDLKGALKDSNELETTETTVEYVEKELEQEAADKAAEDAKTEFQKGYENTKAPISKLMDQGQDSDKEYIARLKKAQDYIVKLVANNDNTVEIDKLSKLDKQIESRIAKIQATIGTETDFTDEVGEKWNKKSLLRATSKLLRADSTAEELKIARTRIGKLVAEGDLDTADTELANKAVEKISAKLGEANTPESKKAVILEQIAKLEVDKETSNKKAKKAIQNKINQLRKGELALNNEIANTKAESTAAQLKANEAREAELVKEDKLRTAESKKARQDYKNAVRKLEIERTMLMNDNMKGSKGTPQELINHRRLSKIRIELEALGSRPKLLSQKELRKIRKATLKQEQLDRAKGRDALAEETAKLEAEDKAAEQEKKDSTDRRERYRYKQSKEQLIAEVDTLDAEIKTIIDGLEGKKLDKVTEGKIQSKMDAKAVLAEQIEGFDEVEYQKAMEEFKEDDKITADRKIDAERAKLEKQQKLDDRVKKNAQDKAKVTIKEVVRVLKKTIGEVDSGTVLSKKQIKARSNKAKVVLAAVVRRTGTNTQEMLKSAELVDVLAAVTGLASNEVVNELTTAQKNRAKSDKYYKRRGKSYGENNPQTAYFEVMQPVHEAVARLRDKELERSDQEIADDHALILKATKSLSIIVQEMSRAQYAQFKKDGQFTQLDKQLSYDELGKLIGMKKGLFEKNMLDAIARRDKVENTVLSKRKFVMRVARAETANEAKDIQLAQEYTKELLKDGALTETQAGTITDMLANVQRRSEAAQAAYEKALADKIVKVTKPVMDAMATENKKMFDNLEPHIRMQLLALTGPTGDIATARIYDVKVTKDDVVITGEC